MEIAFFTEMNFTGKVPRSYANMRVEFAWMCALNADHYNHSIVPEKEYDLAIIILPKNNPNFDTKKYRLSCKKISIMQEGPNWYWQDYSLDKQILYYSSLIDCDIIYAHNESDKKYYQGLTNHSKVEVLSSIMIEDLIKNIKKEDRKNAIIGGNFASWYGGFDSYIVAKEMSEDVYCPSMGRKKAGEESLVYHLPYLDWLNWIKELNKFKYAVHLMRTHAAGTFALNCAYLGIPCIGYEGLDTQQICHPDLTVKYSDLNSARKLAIKLKQDSDFYNHCSEISKKMYNLQYTESVFLEKINKTF